MKSTELLLAGFRPAFAVAVLGSCFLVLIGCRQKAIVNTQRVTLAPTVKETSPFDVAMEFLNNLDQYQPEQVRVEIINNLRDWSRKEDVSVEWFADPMFSRLPKEVKEAFPAERLSTSEFEPHDALELQQAVWLRDVAQYVAAQDLFEPHILADLTQLLTSGSLEKDLADDLKLAYRLFDWTIRNIQLDPEFQDFDILGGQRERERRNRDTLHHQYYPWENLLYGHGDWLERHRVFTLLGRQLGINVVLLVADRGDDQPRQPWASAALLGQELYLFDTLLGLPLPGQGGATFGKLTDYVAHPELLESLSVDGLRYRIVASDLENLISSIDATPAALSQRMKQIETRLSGDQKMVLTVAPTPLARKLRSCKHVSQVQISPQPYRGYQFFQKLRETPEQAVPLLAVLQQEQKPFEMRGPLMRGRLLHLRGYDRGQHDKPGAKKLYMESRMSKKELQRFNIPMELLPEDSPLRMNLPEDPAEMQIVYRQRIEHGRQMAIRAKDQATYWLGAIAFDSHEFKVAADFFTINIEDENSAWRQSANYNLARAYEALGIQNKDSEFIQKAISLYEADSESPQRAGNLLRANRLRRSV